MLFLEIQFKW